MSIFRVNGRGEFAGVSLTTFTHGMVLKPLENFERTEIEGMVLLLLGVNSM